MKNWARQILEAAVVVLVAAFCLLVALLFGLKLAWRQVTRIAGILGAYRHPPP